MSPTDSELVVALDRTMRHYKATEAVEIPVGGGNGATTFLGLTDTPGSYSGHAGRAPLVNVGQDALQFVAVLKADGSVAGATGQAQDFSTNGIEGDVIDESTADAGVTIETVLIKDGNVDGVDISVHAAAGDAHHALIHTHQDGGEGGQLDHGLALTGKGDDDHVQYLLADGSRAGATGQAQDFGTNGIKGDVIAESTADAGVTIDSLLIKDGGLLAIANIVLDDGVSDSPAIVFVGGSFDDTAYIYLDDDQFGAGRSDLLIKLPGTGALSMLYVMDVAGAICLTVYGDKRLRVHGHLGVGSAVPSTSYTIYAREQYTYTTGYRYGILSWVDFDPTGNFTISVNGVYSLLEVGTAELRTGGELCAVKGEAYVYSGRDARSLYLYGGKFMVDVEDAGQYGGTGAQYAAALVAVTPAVDKGKCNNAYGLKIDRGLIGTGSISALFGIYIGSIYGATSNNYAIYTGTGKIRFGDTVYCPSLGVGIMTPLATAHIDQLLSGGAKPVLLLDQADVDYVLMKIKATAEAASADRTLVAASDYGTPGALVGWVQIEIEDIGNRIADADYYIPVYAVPT